MKRLQKTDKLKMKIDEPSARNISIGDLLLFGSPAFLAYDVRYSGYEIVKYDKNKIYYQNREDTLSLNYSDAWVVRKDSSFLIGINHDLRNTLDAHLTETGEKK